MCAVVGLFHATDPAVPDAGALRRMADAVRHRGPDGEGFHAEAHLGLGHRRLAIVDRAGGAQPMRTADGQVVLSFNGEIYNHVALRQQLQAAGHIFRTSSDTEAILLGWREWGLDVLTRLDGMFAFALWDRARGELVLARDRLGEKPLHHARLPDGGWAFGSELSALLALPGLRTRIDPVALDDFMALGYVPDPNTIYAGIRRLPAAHALVLRRGQTEAPAPYRYWQPPTRATPVTGVPAYELACRLDAAVRARLMAEVPIGCFLSGGLDSGAVTALAAREVRGLAAFTIGFAGPADERALAGQVADRCGVAHWTAEAEPDYLAAARQQAGIFGEPFGDHSAVPTLAVCSLARRHVTVALSGDGGDEVFAGYRRYRYHLLAEGIRRLLPPGLRRSALGGLAAAYPALPHAPRWLRARSTLTEMSLDSALGYYRTVCKVQRETRRGLFSPLLRAAVGDHDPAARFGELMAECDPDDPLLQAQYADLHTYLPGDILTKLDRTSMAVSLEVRAPFLAHELVDWGLALPAAQKLRSGIGKRVLRDAMVPYLPAAVLRGPKRGFAGEIGHQLRAAGGTLRRRLTHGVMQDSDLFDTGAILRLIDAHEADRADHSQLLWQLLVLEGFLGAGQAGTTQADLLLSST